MAASVNSTITPWFTSAAVTADEARYAIQGLASADSAAGIGTEVGVLPSVNSGLVTSVSATSVSVAPFQAIVKHATGAAYLVTFPVAVTVPVDANATNSRYTRLYVEILDSDVTAGDAAKVARISTVNGAAAGSPVEPNLPHAGVVELGRLLVTSAAITVADRRLYTRARGGMRLSSSFDSRAGSYPGDTRNFADGTIDVWTGSQWVTSVKPVAWTQFTPKLYTAGTGAEQLLGTGGTAIGRYQVMGKVCHLRYIFRAGTGMAAGWGDVYTTLPTGIISAPSEETQILAKLNAVTTTGGLYAIFNGVCFIPPSSAQMNLYFPVSIDRSDLHSYVMVDTSGAGGTGFPYVPSNFPLPGVLVIQGTIEIT